MTVCKKLGSGFVLSKGVCVCVRPCVRVPFCPSVSEDVEVLPEVDLTPYHCCHHCVEHLYICNNENRFIKFCNAPIGLLAPSHWLRCGPDGMGRWG